MALFKVRYTGVIADRREISVRDLKSRGVNVNHDLVWDASNNFEIILDGDDKTIELLRKEGHFTVTAIDGTGQDGEVIIAATDKTKIENVVVREEGKATQTSKAK